MSDMSGSPPPSGGPVVVRSDIVYGDAMRLWMSVDKEELTLRDSREVLSCILLSGIRVVVLPEMPSSFVIVNKHGDDSTIFCTFTEKSQRDGWLSYLHRSGVPVVNRKGQELPRRERRVASGTRIHSWRM